MNTKRCIPSSPTFGRHVEGRGARVEGTWAASTADFCLGSGAYYRCYDSFFLNFKKIQILKREVSEERQTSKNSVFLEKSSFVKF